MKRSNINLLICLDALLTERSVTRAAERLGMSQPGVSNALARLRELTGDPLLVRSGNGFLLTERAQALARKVRTGIELMDDIFTHEGPLDLASASGTVTLALAESMGLAYMPALAQAVATQAPALVLNVRAPDPAHLREWLAEGECDVAIGHFPDLAPDLRSHPLLEQPLACIHARGTVRGTLTLSEYLARSHVVFGSPFSPRSTLEQTLGAALAAAGHERRRLVRVSSVMLIPYIVAGSQHVATLPEWICRHFATLLPLQVSPVPVAVPSATTVMVWHERTHRLALHRWLREQVREIVPGAATLGFDIRAPAPRQAQAIRPLRALDGGAAR
ncbi:LysR family transcriptional regulator [Xenophilus arseniciresistens]|uniref:LysR family transcriptional regulator n=1 Tax=Xenophilus arseniciresistens TaxID=1283306 RepID=A0AAE3N7L8_9BURK|nr:LysR family transcriptional regulator [Xenophilus arseniciresistens]MDA7416611.1 LysR family transcriptional regulator [Xenophilus arseniciresistens]